MSRESPTPSTIAVAVATSAMIREYPIAFMLALSAKIFVKFAIPLKLIADTPSQLQKLSTTFQITGMIVANVTITIAGRPNSPPISWSFLVLLIFFFLFTFTVIAFAVKSISSSKKAEKNTASKQITIILRQ